MTRMLPKIWIQSCKIPMPNEYLLDNVNFQHKKASLSSRASQEKETRPKPLLLNMEEQVLIKSVHPTLK